MTDPKNEFKTAQLDDWLRAAQKSAPCFLSSSMMAGTKVL